VAFFTTAGNVVPGKLPGSFDVFVRDRGAATSFVAFCAGDSSCPCGNVGLAHHGCQNSAGTGGGLLAAAGQASLSSDTVVLSASAIVPGASCVVLQGSARIGAVPVGDGLRCAGGQLLRMYVLPAPSGSLQAPQPGDPSLSARSAAFGAPIPLGATRVLQVTYRDTNAAFCPAPQGDAFNATNAIAIA